MTEEQIAIEKQRLFDYLCRVFNSFNGEPNTKAVRQLLKEDLTKAIQLYIEYSSSLLVKEWLQTYTSKLTKFEITEKGTVNFSIQL